MPAILGLLGGGRTLLYAGLALAAAAALLWLLHLVEQVGAQRATIAVLEQTNKQNDAQLAHIKADYQRAADALNAAHAQERARTSQALEISGNIAHAPASDHGPVPRVILRTIDGLFGGASARSPDPGGAASGAGAAPGVPGGAAKAGG